MLVTLILHYGEMYINSEYIPVIKNHLGEGISTAYGVTQGRKPSTYLYSLYVAHMPGELHDQNTDFVDPFDKILLTLASSQTILHCMLITLTHLNINCIVCW